MIKVIRQNNPHLIHGWHLFTSPYAGFSAKFLGVNSLGSLRVSFRKFYQNPIAALLSLIVNDGITVNSMAAASRLRKIKVNTKQEIFVVQNAFVNNIIQYQSRESLLDRCNITEKMTIIGSIGRLDKKKRFDLLLKTMAILNKDQGYHLVIIGDGPERASLVTLSEKLGISGHVTLMGEIANAEMWLKAFDIFAYTSLDEGMPNVIMEAAAAELPIVTWRLPFFEELLIDEKSGLLVEPKNIEKMKEGIIRLVKSEELRRQLGKAARENILENFNLQRFLYNMTEAYETILVTSIKQANHQT